MTEVANDTTVDGRYKILGRIGSGGMADVYRAQDTHLGREVALKVLHRRFAQDAEFVERFRREAKAAAGLQHPNVVGVYDRGDHDGTYYIAMEHLRGRTLKEIVNEEAPLDQMRVIDIGVQVLNAAGFAHKRGVIHRDFKPHNVIVDAEGVPKVTDFGIARAGASEMTETGSIMGTAQYLSPEQAQGHAVTAASDLYSIGVMLYEMLTGKLPFGGDSAVSIALKHLSEPPPPMQGVEPNLEGVVLGALAKDPAARWQSAEDFAEALEACRPYVEAHGQEVSQDTAVFAPVPGPADAPVAVAAPVEELRDEEERPRRWPAIALVLLVLALIGLMAYAFSRPEKSEVPKVTALQLPDARERLDRVGFEKVDVERERSFAEVDRVLRQNPDPGEQAAKDDTITLIVSSGPGQVVVPSVRNTRTELAIRELEKAELKVTADPQASDTVKKGFAIGTSPEEGARVERGSRVRLFVSSGPEQATMPDVVGLTRDAAETKLTREGLDVRVERRESDEPEDDVISQTPAAGTKLDKGERVTIVVSEGRKQVDVPNLVGLPEADARRLLRSEGLGITVRRRTTNNQEEDGQVLDQRPGAGTEVDEGRSVIVIVGRYEPPATPPDPGVPPAASP